MIEIQNPNCRSATVAMSRRRQVNRNGLTMIELVISATVLMTVMTLVATLSVSINQVWKDIGHHRVAAGELSNQLEVLTRLSRKDAEAAVASLVPSEVCARTLMQPELTGTLVDDNLGTRVVLHINWNRRHPGNPIEMVGWLSNRQTVAENSDSDSDSDRNSESNQ